MQNKTTQNPLGSEKIGRLLFQFSVPTIFTLLVNYLYNIIDQIFVGRGVGITGIAATNVAFPFTTLCLALALLIGDGCAANISLHLGRKEQEKANQTFGNGFCLLILLGIGIVVVGSVFIKPLVLIFGASQTVFASAVDYSRIIILGLPFMMFNVAFTAIIRSDGNPKYTMKIMMLGALINLVLDPIFIFYFHMGVTGAAIATIMGQIVSGILCLRYISKFRTIQFSKKNMALKGHISIKILTLGIPSFVTQLATALTQIIMNNLMRHYGAQTVYGSDIALSCYGMMMKVYQIAHAMFVGVSSGTQPINGFNFGAKQYSRVKETYRIAAITSIVISLCWFIVFQLFSPQITALFIKGNDLYNEFSIHCFKLYMLAFFCYGLPMATASFFQAIGKPFNALIISLCRQVLFLIPLSVALSGRFGIDGALYAAPVADILTFLVAICFVVFEFKNWKKLQMV